MKGAQLLPLAILVVMAIASAGSRGYGERSFNANATITPQSYAISVGMQAAQSFVPTEPYVLENVSLYIQNVGTPGDALNVTIRADAAGSPGASDLAATERV